MDKPVTGLEDSNDTSQYNIWSHRKLRAFRSPREGRGTKQQSEYRCLPTLHSGWTRGSRSGCAYCCLYFARGICHHGRDCNYLHRVPTEADEQRHRTEPQYDIFGRDRIAEERGTKGVGSYSRQCTTLYIYLGGAAALPVETLREKLSSNFKEWGPVEDVKVVPSKSIAFVRYAWRSSAEFAKAAMHQQTLGREAENAVLDVRWANDDSNPIAQLRTKREQEESLAEAYMNAVEIMNPETKKAKLHGLSLAAAYLPGAAASAYPDTSTQYGTEEYEGWDARAYADAERRGNGGEMQAGDGVLSNEPASSRGLNVEQGGTQVVDDDVSRYLLPGDVLEEENDRNGRGPHTVGVDVKGSVSKEKDIDGELGKYVNDSSLGLICDYDSE